MPIDYWYMGMSVTSVLGPLEIPVFVLLHGQVDPALPSSTLQNQALYLDLQQELYNMIAPDLP